VIPKFANLSLAGKSPIIYGDGKQTRDFTFVRDVVQANVLAMGSDATGVFNVATGTRISVNDLAGMVMEIIGNRVDCVHEVERAGVCRTRLGISHG
jgi:UDP-glucose 4-epimerase